MTPACTVRNPLRAFAALLIAFAAVPGGAEPTPDADLVRLAEASRLADAVRARIWPGWEATPFPVLLVTPERELLVRFPGVPEGFESVGRSSVLGDEILVRERVLEPTLMATFPAFGMPPVVVIGSSKETGRTSSEWLLTVVHEHFHQYQMSDSGYFEAVEGLGLSGGDETGKWMLGYPFPYRSPAVASGFAELSRRLAKLLLGSSARDRRAFWTDYEAFLGSLREEDRRYLGFQVWQEGVARYVELRAASSAAAVYEPSPEFAALPDAEPFKAVATRIHARIQLDLENPNLTARRRTSFYAFGAGLAFLLDQDRVPWQERYLHERFALERFAPKP